MRRLLLEKSQMLYMRDPAGVVVRLSIAIQKASSCWISKYAVVWLEVERIPPSSTETTDVSQLTRTPSDWLFSVVRFLSCIFRRVSPDFLESAMWTVDLARLCDAGACSFMGRQSLQMRCSRVAIVWSISRAVQANILENILF